MGKSTIPMVIFSSYVKLPEGRMFLDSRISAEPLRNTFRCFVGHQIYLRISWTISENIRICRWSSERLKDIMRILSRYHFRDMHSVILRKEKEANTTSRTAHAVCIQNSGFVFVFPLRSRFAKDLHSDNHWILLVIEYQIHLILIIMLWSI